MYLYVGYSSCVQQNSVTPAFVSIYDHNEKKKNNLTTDDQSTTERQDKLKPC